MKNLTLVLAVALLPLSLAAQDSDLAGLPREGLASPEFFQNFMGEIQLDSLSKAEDALVIVHQATNPGNQTLVVTLRNEDWRSVTAWSIAVTVGSTDGLTYSTTHAVDNLVGLVPGTPPGVSPIEPGESREQTLRLSRPIDLSDDRYAYGNYDVLAVRVDAVVFDDGTFAGQSLRPIKGFLQNRFARTLATQDFLWRLDEALNRDTVRGFLHDALTLAKDRQTLTKPVARRFGDSTANMEHIVNQQWASSILWLASPEDAAALPQSGPVVMPEGIDVEALRTAAEQVRRAADQEVGVYLDNLPSRLADYASETARVER